MIITTRLCVCVCATFERDDRHANCFSPATPTGITFVKQNNKQQKNIPLRLNGVYNERKMCVIHLTVLHNVGSWWQQKRLSIGFNSKHGCIVYALRTSLEMFPFHFFVFLFSQFLWLKKMRRQKMRGRSDVNDVVMKTTGFLFVSSFSLCRGCAALHFM